MLKKILVLVLAVAICFAGAEPGRQKPLRRRVSARQQLAQPTAAPTGYAPAGVTPAVPFDLPTETQEPDAVYGPPEAEPDVVYGPPEAEPDVVYGPPEAEPDVVYGPPEAEPDVVYGPPEAEPDVVYGPPEAVPDDVYGSPQADVEPQPDTVYGPPETAAQEPDTVYGPPQTDIVEEIPEGELVEETEGVDDEVLLNEDGSIIVISTVEEKPARLVYQRFPQRRQPSASVPARLRLAKISRPRNFVYTARYQSL